MGGKEDLEVIKEKVKQGKYYISYTHTEKLRMRKIEASYVEEAVLSGDIIESYLNDPRGPSYLILGYTSKNQPLHILCGKLEEEEILIITAYEPDPLEWEKDWKTRKRKGSE